jgi:integrase
VPKKLPWVLSVAEAQAILDACPRLRDRFLFALLHETGIFSRGAKRTCASFSCFGCSVAW